MSNLSLDSIKKALSAVIDPASGRDVISAGMISGVVIKEGKVGFVLTIATPQLRSSATQDVSTRSSATQDVSTRSSATQAAPRNGASHGSAIPVISKDSMEQLRKDCERAVAALPLVMSVTAVMTAQDSTPIPPKPESGYTQPRERAQWNLTPLEGVKRIIAVASGKGGVGKSTTTINLALALMRMGKRVGILDADIYGPSLPRMTGLSGQPPIENGKMLPPTFHGMPCMSMGFITGDQAAVLRGPMISKTLHQMLRFTHWGHAGALDVLLVDMPPGTGDIHLSLAQAVLLSGAVIVTTPQEVAVMDARKCLHTFGKLNVPVLGVVENMSWYEAAGQKVALFGEGGGRRLALETGVAFLGEIPIDPRIGAAAEAAHAYDGAYETAYNAIAQQFS